MRFTIPEILKYVSAATSHQEKVRILRANASETLEQVLQYNFHPDIKFSLPEGPAPYKKEVDLPVGKSHSNLYKEGRRLYLFLEGHAPNLKPYRRESLFIELLEGIHWTEADMMLLVKDKKLTEMFPGVTYEAARDAFDRLLPATAPKAVAKPVKLAIPDLEVALAAKEQVTPVDSPLEVSAVPPVTSTVSSPLEAPIKVKKPATPGQLAGLAKGRANRAAKKLAALAASQAG